MTKPDIRQLWEGMVQGDETLFLRLFRLLYPALQTYGIRILPDQGLVKDTIHQTFLYFWEKRNQLGHVLQHEGYIYTSFRRQLLSIAGQSDKLSFPGDFTEVGAEQTIPSHEDFLIHLNSTQELQQVIAAAVSRLSERKQLFIRLRYYEGLSYADIAARTGVSERTIYNKIHEAIKNLRRELAKAGFPQEILSSVQLLLR
ncbi:sigma-70 family RNA polymerase sigma factor [Chitinophaga sp. G-6-1-13]|uniref:Sigma-70 family RNA polymerase sigma factor n=1 Tax=Chitinophaga fulva TaxID=2728842 RepID=A0A848GN37_9BACT|nr:sigma-70 family RNA polymerase sigma factor [Chitinophaga fulva]NML39824.1 sigma-70 family RNA polymerase sigma factor [Chitinophaga fulva]